jgi:hypothetical protein
MFFLDALTFILTAQTSIPNAQMFFLDALAFILKAQASFPDK